MAILKRWLAGLLAILFALTSAFASAESPPAARSGVVGFWVGTMVQNSIAFRTVLHVTKDTGGGLSVSMESVEQHATLPGQNAVLKDNGFSFEIGSVGKYQGTLAPDGNTMSGTWTQQGITVPLNFARTSASAVPTPAPLSPARPPVALNDLKPVLDRELEPVLRDGLLSTRTGGGLVIGVLDHGQRRIFAYGTAKPDSIFEIGSITKTFTGLILAQMVVQKKVTLTEPVIELLPKDFQPPHSESPQITLLDLATQHSGLPRDADNLEAKNAANPYADYDAPKLADYVRRRGLTKQPGATFIYSNVGFGLLGYALSSRAGVGYEELLQTEVIGPLQLRDTVITLSAEQRKRLIQGYDASFNKASAWDFDVLAGAGAVKSSASDMLTYLDANLHPEKYAAGGVPGSPAATLSAALALDHEPQAVVGPEGKIALAWLIDLKTDWFDSAGQSGNGSVAIFNPRQDWAVIALYNRHGPFPRFVDAVGENVAQLLEGRPSVRVDVLTDAEKNALAHMNGGGSIGDRQ